MVQYSWSGIELLLPVILIPGWLTFKYDHVNQYLVEFWLFILEMFVLEFEDKDGSVYKIAVCKVFICFKSRVITK